MPGSVIVSQIRSSKSRFDLTTPAIIQLTKAGAGPDLIEAMRNPGAVPPRTAPASAAQGTPAEPPSAPATGAPAVGHSLPRGRPVTIPGGVALSIALTEEVPANPSPGRVLHFTVARDLRIEDAVAVAKGTPLTGEIVDSGGGRKLLIKKTKATFRVATVQAVDGSKLAIRAAPGKRTDKVDAPIQPPGYHDKDNLAPAGSQFLVYFEGDQSVTVRK